VVGLCAMLDLTLSLVSCDNVAEEAVLEAKGIGSQEIANPLEVARRLLRFTILFRIVRPVESPSAYAGGLRVKSISTSREPCRGKSVT